MLLDDERACARAGRRQPLLKAFDCALHVSWPHTSSPCHARQLRGGSRLRELVPGCKRRYFSKPGRISHVVTHVGALAGAHGRWHRYRAADGHVPGCGSRVADTVSVHTPTRMESEKGNGLLAAVVHRQHGRFENPRWAHRDFPIGGVHRDAQDICQLLSHAVLTAEAGLADHKHDVGITNITTHARVMRIGHDDTSEARRIQDRFLE